jgi:hypothetical protein
VDLLEPAERDNSPPVESVFDLIRLKTNVRVGAHDFDLTAGRRVDADFLAIEDVIDRDDVRLAVATASQSSDALFAQQFARLSIANFAKQKQRYWRNDSHRSSRDNPRSKRYTEDEKERILNPYEEWNSMRGLERVIGVSHKTVSDRLEKTRQRSQP